MPKKFYTFRGRHTGRFYYATALNAYEAARIIGISIKDLILERSEVLPRQASLKELEN